MKSFLRLAFPTYLLLGVAGAAGCATSPGDPEGSEGGTYPSGGTGGAGGAASASGAGGAGGAGQGGAGQGGAGEGGAGGETGAGGGAESALTATTSTMAMTMNCQPGGAPSAAGTFQAYYDNTKGAAGSIAIVKSAKLTMTLAAQSYVWTFADVTPKSTFVAAGASSNVTHTAQMGSGSGTGALCDYCGQIWKLDVQWDLGGKTGSGSVGPVPVNCVQ